MDRSIDWLSGWLSHWSFDWLIEWEMLMDGSVDWLIDWLSYRIRVDSGILRRRPDVGLLLSRTSLERRLVDLADLENCHGLTEERGLSPAFSACVQDRIARRRRQEHVSRSRRQILHPGATEIVLQWIILKLIQKKTSALFKKMSKKFFQKNLQKMFWKKSSKKIFKKNPF